GDYVARLWVDLQVAVHAGCAASVADPAVPVLVSSIFEAIRVLGAGPRLHFSGDQQLGRVGAEQLVAQERDGESCEVADGRVATAGRGAAIRQPVGIRDGGGRIRWFDVSDRASRNRLVFR